MVIVTNTLLRDYIIFIRKAYWLNGNLLKLHQANKVIYIDRRALFPPFITQKLTRNRCQKYILGTSSVLFRGYQYCLCSNLPYAEMLVKNIEPYVTLTPKMSRILQAKVPKSSLRPMRKWMSGNANELWLIASLALLLWRLHKARFLPILPWHSHV